MRTTLILAGVAVVAAAGLYSSFESGRLRFNYPSQERFPVLGVDVSHHQGRIDWTALARQRVVFAYIKATEGGDFQDRRYDANVVAAAAAGIRPGAYHFFSFCRDASTQAANFCGALQRRPELSLPPAVDVEFGGNCRSPPPMATVRQRLRSFLKRVETCAEQAPVVYLTPEARAPFAAEVARSPLWLRDIFGEPQPPWMFWQFANRGRLEGVDGPVDLNVYAGTAL